MRNKKRTPAPKICVPVVELGDEGQYLILTKSYKQPSKVCKKKSIATAYFLDTLTQQDIPNWLIVSVF